MTDTDTADTDFDVAEDSGLTAGEKETIIRFANDEDDASVFSEEHGIMKRLLDHPEADVEPDRRSDDGTVCAVRGAVPVDILKIGSTPRTTGSKSDVVATYR